MKLLISTIIALAILAVIPQVCAADYLDKYPVWPDRYGSHILGSHILGSRMLRPHNVVPLHPTMSHRAIPMIVKPRPIRFNGPVLGYRQGQPLRNVLRGVGKVGVGTVVITARGLQRLGNIPHNVRGRINNGVPHYNSHQRYTQPQLYRCRKCGRVHYHN